MVIIVIGVYLLRAKRPPWVAITFHTNTAPAVAALEQLGEAIAATRDKQREATEAVHAARQALDVHNAHVAARGSSPR